MIFLSTAYKYFVEEFKVPYHGSFQKNFNFRKNQWFYLCERDELNTPNRIFKRQEIQEIIDIHPRRKVIYSSRFNISTLEVTKKIKYLVFLQNPLDKIVSDYLYIKNTNKIIIKKKKNFNVNSYIESIIEKKFNNCLFNKQTDFLFYGMNVKNKINYIKGKINQNSLVILPMERFFDCSIFLKNFYPDYFPNIYDDNFFKLDFKNTKQMISKNLKIKIDNYLLEDQNIYDLANKSLDQRMTKTSKKLIAKKLKCEIKYKCYYKKYSNFLSKIINFSVKILLFFSRPILKKYFL